MRKLSAFLRLIAVLPSVLLTVSCQSTARHVRPERGTPRVPRDPIERFAAEAPLGEQSEYGYRYPLPPTEEVVALLLEKRAKGQTDHLVPLVEYGLRIHWNYLKHSQLARELPLQENMMLAELVRIAKMPRYTTAHEAGWLNRQFDGHFEGTGWSSYQIYIWAKENDRIYLRGGDQRKSKRSIGELLKVIDRSAMNGVGGGGVCHYGCR